MCAETVFQLSCLINVPGVVRHLDLLLVVEDVKAFKPLSCSCINGKVLGIIHRILQHNVEDRKIVDDQCGNK